jgi:hypothetical protein
MVWAGRWVRIPVDLGQVFSETEVQWSTPSEMTLLITLKAKDNADFEDQQVECRATTASSFLWRH